MLNLTSNEIELGLLVLVVIIGAALTFIQHKNDSKTQLIAEMRQEILMLFLQAEKLGFVGTDKFNYVVKLIYAKFPDMVKAILTEQTVETYVQKLYDEFKQYLVDGKITDFDFVPSTNDTKPDTPAVDPTPAPVVDTGNTPAPEQK